MPTPIFGYCATLHQTAWDQEMYSMLTINEFIFNGKKLKSSLSSRGEFIET